MNIPCEETFPFRILILGACSDIFFTIPEFSSDNGQIIFIIAAFCDAFMR
jgi:hypothetical protein